MFGTVDNCDGGKRQAVPEFPASRSVVFIELSVLDFVFRRQRSARPVRALPPSTYTWAPVLFLEERPPNAMPKRGAHPGTDAVVAGFLGGCL
jgi:hypothetical protein